jgi:O-antigen ligase
VLEFLPSFRDVNAEWRLLYWKHVLHNVVVQHYMILGNGFGRPFMTYDFALYLNATLHSPIMIDELYPMARYLSPPHNSILTILFHVGLLPGLLLVIPLRRFFGQILLRSRSADPSVNFLVYALPGCLVWVMFNVILELPHSATFFWLLYLTTAYALKMQDRPALAER